MICFFASITCCAAEPPAAEPAVDESTHYAVETVLTGLDQPVSVAVRPGADRAGPFEVFVSESGAGRIVRFTTDDAAVLSPVVTGFPLGAVAWPAGSRGGPLGVEFLSPNRLAVGSGGLELGRELVQVYALPEDGRALAYDEADHAVGPVPRGSRTTAGEGDFASLAKTEDALLVVAGAGDARGWILKAILDANRLADLQPFIPLRDAAGVGQPRAVVIHPGNNYHYLVAAAAGDDSAQRDSRLAMFSPSSGEMALCVNTGLYDMAGLAYSPTGDLYAIDYAAARPGEAGVFRLEAAPADVGETCRPVRIAKVDRPTALAFTPDGVLYVAAIGAKTSAADKPTGTVLKITPKPETPKL